MDFFFFVEGTGYANSMCTKVMHLDLSICMRDRGIQSQTVEFIQYLYDLYIYGITINELST